MFEITRKLDVWKVSHELVMEVYRITEGFPSSEQFGLQSQVRRAVVSVPSNIIEGKSRRSDREFRRFLLIARASLDEVKYQVFLSHELGYVEDESYNAFVDSSVKVGKMINGLVNRINQSNDH